MKILVTGGAGFIGSALVDRLIELGHSIVVIDNLTWGKVKHLHSKVKLYKADIKRRVLQEIISNEKITHVFHLAAQTDLQEFGTDPLTEAKNNVIGTLNLLECCWRSDVQKIIFSSTAAVYGNPETLPVGEDHLIQPQSFYGLSKYVCENYIHLYQKLYRLDYTIFRYPIVYGPRQDENSNGGVVANFLTKMIRNHSPVIFGDGTQSRDFVYVQDVVEANIQALYYGNNQILNISSNVEVTDQRLLEELNQILGMNILPLYEPGAREEIECFCLDNARARTILNWSPRYDLKSGLIETVNYYSNILDYK